MKIQTRAYKSRTVTAHWVSALFVLAAAGCGGGGGDSPAAAPAPAPAPAPLPAPGPAPAPAMPTIAPAVDLDDNHQVGVASAFWSDGNTATGGAGQDVLGVPCPAAHATAFSINSHLSIFVNGQAQAIASRVGYVDAPAPGCHYFVHTHDRSGKVHMEGPTPTTFTLGQLFAIWGQPLTATNVAGVQNLAMSVYITENSTVTAFSGDPATLPLLSHRHVAIVLGTPVAQVPFFTWTGN